MKSYFICAFLVLWTFETYSQVPADTSTPLTKKEYLEDSRAHKVLGLVFLGGGAALLTYAASGDVSFDTLPVVLVGGAALTIASIPLFISSSRNKRRAMKATSSLDIRRDPVPGPIGNLPHTTPTLSVHLKF